MAELDESQEAVRNVDRITDSEPVNGEELLRSEDLKRQLLASTILSVFTSH